MQNTWRHTSCIASAGNAGSVPAAAAAAAAGAVGGVGVDGARGIERRRVVEQRVRQRPHSVHLRAATRRSPTQVNRDRARELELERVTVTGREMGLHGLLAE